MSIKTLPLLDDEQVRVLGSMNLYWQEIVTRDPTSTMKAAAEEMYQLMQVLSPMQILLICGAYPVIMKTLIELEDTASGVEADFDAGRLNKQENLTDLRAAWVDAHELISTMKYKKA